MRLSPLRAGVTAACGLACALASTSALAGGVLPISAGVGVLATVDANFLPKPGDLTNASLGGTDDGSYPGFGGTGFGAGGMIDVRFFKIVGVEMDILRTSDRGHGTDNGQTIDIGQNAWHLPLLAKVTFPLGILQPQIFAGPEFVFPDTGSATITPGNAAYSVTASSPKYTMVAFGLGAEIALPIPGIDLRIPFSLRGGVDPGVSDHDTDRVTYAPPSATPGAAYSSEWKLRASATLGVSYYFL
jgi:Outer membrane protein beta-barrel domain